MREQSETGGDTDTDIETGFIHVTLSPYGTYKIRVSSHVAVDDLLTIIGHSPSLYLVWINGQLVSGSTELAGGDEVLVRPVRSYPVLRKPAQVAAMLEGKPLTSIGKASRGAPLCDHCQEEAAVTERTFAVPPLVGHLRLCASCFCALIERHVLRTILWWNLVEPQDHIMIPVSGEKDSMCTFYMLARFQEHYPETTITGCIVDEGMGEYSIQRILAAQNLADQLHFPLKVLSFKHATGYTLPELVAAARESPQGLQHRPCYLCNVLKENLLQSAARDIGATKVALSRNYNDRLNAILQGVLLQDLTAMGNAEFKGTLTIFNLPYISIIGELCEKDISIYLYLSGVEVHWHDEVECPFSESAIIGHLNYLVSDLESVSPGSSNFIMSAYNRYLKSMTKDTMIREFSRCTQCGVQFSLESPEADTLCPACRVLAQYDFARRVT